MGLPDDVEPPERVRPPIPLLLELLGQWRSIIWSVFINTLEDRVMLIAAGVTYYMLLALVPGLTIVVAVYGLFTDPANVAQQVDLLASFVPEGGLVIIHDELVRLTGQTDNNLTLTLVISLGMAMLGSSASVRALFDAMNVAYGEKEKRSIWASNGQVFLFTLLGAFVVVILLGVSVVMPNVIGRIPLATDTEWLIETIGGAVLLSALTIAIASLYRWGPSRKRAKWRWILPGVAFAVLFMSMTSNVFTWYASNFANFGAAYGSLGALIGFLTWIWLAIIILIVGAELNAEIETRATTGRAPPVHHHD